MGFMGAARVNGKEGNGSVRSSKIRWLPLPCRARLAADTALTALGGG